MGGWLDHRLCRTALPFSQPQAISFDSLAAFEDKLGVLQLLRDTLAVSEWGGSAVHVSDLRLQYQALRCGVEPLADTDPDFRNVVELVCCANDEHRDTPERQVEVLKVYRLRHSLTHTR